jgi:hypothetical protein
MPERPTVENYKNYPYFKEDGSKINSPDDDDWDGWSNYE